VRPNLFHHDGVVVAVVRRGRPRAVGRVAEPVVVLMFVSVVLLVPGGGRRCRSTVGCRRREESDGGGGGRERRLRLLLLEPGARRRSEQQVQSIVEDVACAACPLAYVLLSQQAQRLACSQYKKLDNSPNFNRGPTDVL
jgi:hypothetical protein